MKITRRARAISRHPKRLGDSELLKSTQMKIRKSRWFCTEPMHNKFMPYISALLWVPFIPAEPRSQCHRYTSRF